MSECRFKERKCIVWIYLTKPSDIQICNVKPIPEDNPLFIEAGTDIPEKIASFYQVNDVRRFQLDRPVHKGPVDKDNEFKVSVINE